MGLVWVEGGIQDVVHSGLVSSCSQPVDVHVTWQRASQMCLCGVALFEVRGVSRTWGDSGGSCIHGTTVTTISRSANVGSMELVVFDDDIVIHDLPQLFLSCLWLLMRFSFTQA